MNSFYSQEELKEIGFRHIGSDVFVSRKSSIYGAENISIKNHVRIDDFCILSGKITIGAYVHISAFAAIHGDTVGVEIEDFCTVSGRVSLYAVSDNYSGEYLMNSVIPEKYRGVKKGKIILKKYSALGAGCVVLPGITLGEGSVAGAMSLIVNDLKPWMIYAGIPCRELKARSKQLLKLEELFVSNERENIQMTKQLSKES